jgi:hypothetical protein
MKYGEKAVQSLYFLGSLLVGPYNVTIELSKDFLHVVFHYEALLLTNA